MKYIKTEPSPGRFVLDERKEKEIFCSNFCVF